MLTCLRLLEMREKFSNLASAAQLLGPIEFLLHISPRRYTQTLFMFVGIFVCLFGFILSAVKIHTHQRKLGFCGSDNSFLQAQFSKTD